MNHTNYQIETPKDIELLAIKMTKSGHGHYYVNVDFVKDDKKQFKSISTSDSMLFDEFYSDESTWHENAPQAAFDLFVESI